MNELKYKIIRTARKTVAIQIKPDKTIIVRAPKRMSKEQIHSLVQSKEKWIQKHLNELENHSEGGYINGRNIKGIGNKKKLSCI